MVGQMACRVREGGYCFHHRVADSVSDRVKEVDCYCSPGWSKIVGEVPIVDGWAGLSKIDGLVDQSKTGGLVGQSKIGG